MSFRQAIALGVLHGPTELLPISSSGHTTVVPWLLGSSYGELDPQTRKALEVALHSGAVAALLIARRPHRVDPAELLVIVVATVPAGLTGLLLERRIEARLGTPATIAAGLILGALALGLADRRPEQRRAEEARAGDAVWIGVAQAAALIPGVSRNGATLAAARFLGFRRQDATQLSYRLAFPVIIGATLLKAWRLRQRPELAGQGPQLAAGALTSLASTLLARTLIGGAGLEPPLLGYAAYRAGLAATILMRLKRDSVP